jgi:hypothetical protein
MKTKTEKVTLKDDDGSKETFKIKKGALKKQLKVPDEYRFNSKELNRMKDVENGRSFNFKGNTFKMTALLKRRITLALTLMRGSK